MTRRSIPWRLFAASLALAAAGCAQSNGDVSQVQPNVVKKGDLLDGQWFFRNTVTWTPFNTQFTFPGQTGNMEKVVWEVQQNFLVGYRSYPFTPGSEANVDQDSIVSGTTAKYCDAAGKCVGGYKYYGAPIVAFPIASHFDVQRVVNTSTGEPTNVITENTTDRPWNQREFMRVNWAANVLNQQQGMMWNTVQNPNNPLLVGNANWIQPNEPDSDPYDWPTFEYTDRDGDDVKELTYFDVTGRYLANPASINYYGYILPYCWFSYGDDCASSEIRMRISVAKVDESWSRDYEPLVYGNDLMAYFGFFRTERLTWDQKFGVTESGRILLAQRHRIWKEYYRKSDGKVTGESIPLAQREPTPVKYYFTPAHKMGGAERYKEFWEPGRVIERDFDRSFRRAVAAAKGDGSSDYQSQPQMFHLCNNPVTVNDPGACGTPGFSPKIGDLRYSFVNTVAEPVANGLLGYGPSSADPETGQLISGMSNTYTWGVDQLGRDVLNWIHLLNGDVNVNEYISGKIVQDFIANHKTYNVRTINGALQAGLQGTPTRNEESIGAFDRPTSRLSNTMSRILADKNSIRGTGDVNKRMVQELAKHPDLEAVFLDNPEVKADLVGLLPTFARAEAARNPELLRAASRDVLLNVREAHKWEKQRIEELSRNSITTFDFYDRTLLELAARKQGERINRINTLMGEGMTLERAAVQADDELAKSLRQQVWLATALHETGHTLNLRHNFQGSFDSVNYFDEYWEIRKPTLTVDQNGVKKLPRTPADLKMVADATDAVGQLSLFEGLHRGEYSSIMDYSGRTFNDWNGLGKYDEAAIIFAYSGDSEPGWVEVFDSARRTSVTLPGSDGANVTVSGAGADLPMVNVTHTNPSIPNYTERFHYTMVPLHFGEATPGAPVESVIESGVNKLRERHLERWSTVVADEQRVREALLANPTLIDDPDTAAGVIGDAKLRVPYMFCSDESADGPVLSCNRFDLGADYYQMVTAAISQYWSYYFDSHFRRDAPSFSGNSALYSTYRAFNLAANSYKHWVYEFYKKSEANQEQVLRYKFDATFQDMWTMAVLDGINQHLAVMTVPPDGFYMFRPNLVTGPRWDVISQGEDYDYETSAGVQRLTEYAQNRGATNTVVVPRGLGRRMYSSYDFKGGYGFFTRMNEAGHYFDQIGAMFAAVDPYFEVQGVDQTADFQRYTIPYYLVFRDELQDTFSALWTEDENKLRPTLFKQPLETYPVGGDDGIGEVAGIEWPTFVRGTDFFQGFNYPRVKGTCAAGQNPFRDDCFDSAGRMTPAPANIQVTWTSQQFGLLYGMAFFSANYDLDYAKANQIYKLGAGDSFTVASGWRTVEFHDPRTGHRYVAVEPCSTSCPAHDPNLPYDSTPAVRMINISNEILQMVNDPGTCPVPAYLVQLGWACMDQAQANNPSLVEDRRRYWLETLQFQVGMLDMQRGFYTIFGKAW